LNVFSKWLVTMGESAGEAEQPNLTQHRSDWSRLLTYLRSHKLRTFGFVAALVIAFLVLWQVPKQQTDNSTLVANDRIERENDARTTIAQIMVGIVLLGGLYFTFRNVAAAERKVGIAQENLGLTQKNIAVAQTNVAVAQQNLAMTERGQITERFTRAIEQLGAVNKDGDPQLEIRIGGIYALESIAADSDRYYAVVMDVLTTYVRMNAPYVRDLLRDEPPSMPPEMDIQATLAVIGRRRTPKTIVNEKLDLTGCNLAGLRMNTARLDDINFSRSDLRDAFFQESTFRRNWFDFTDLRGSTFLLSTFEDNAFRGTIVESAHFNGCPGITMEVFSLTGAPDGRTPHID